ncbi:hypothetical protein AVEN_119567-1 [Araneus ventricosus]|uniref:Uncharacterized protein n=1 Tax=Araneus ventricosus TaxID=182803 RepID=A0A4Y2E5X6_ARAVE|nr:hypothetical protein AVEN_119567-1 [Araneus ventricosus]
MRTYLKSSIQRNLPELMITSITDPCEKAAKICSRISYLEKLRRSTNTKKILYEPFSHAICGPSVLISEADLTDTSALWTYLQHLVNKAQGELRNLAACPIPNCIKHNFPIFSSRSVNVKNTPKH